MKIYGINKCCNDEFNAISEANWLKSHQIRHNKTNKTNKSE